MSQMKIRGFEVMIVLLAVAFAGLVVAQVANPVAFFSEGYTPGVTITPLASYANKTDFLVQVVDYEPKVVRSDLLEEQQVPVYAQLALVKANPIISEPLIRGTPRIIQKGANEFASVVYIPPAQGITNLGNIGYALVLLRQMPESKMPDSVDIDVRAEVMYDAKYALGIREESFSLKKIFQIFDLFIFGITTFFPF